MNTHPHVVVVGSGPIGATYARILLESHPSITVTMFEAGPQLTEIPGESVRNIPDDRERERARKLSQGPQAGEFRESLGLPAGTIIEGTFTARHGTHLLDFGGEGSSHAQEFPAAACSTNVGGQGAHWTCAVPRPGFSERPSEIPHDELESLLDRAEQLLHVTHEAFAGSAVGGAIRSLLAEEFAGELPPEFSPSLLPVAGDEQPDGTMRWSGTDVILGELVKPGSEVGSRFTLQPLHLVKRVLHESARVNGVEVENLTTGVVTQVQADAVVVAGDAFRSPQLLWASGIRPAALGRFLTEHPMVISTVALDQEKMGRFATESDLVEELERRAKNPSDPVSAVNRIPFSEPDHPFSAQVMYSETPPFPLPEDHPHAGNRWGYVNMGFGLRKRPRAQDGIVFSETETDYRGLPSMSIEYSLGNEEEAELTRAEEQLRRAGEALGTFIAPPRRMPAGSSLHYMGTMRMGESDDGNSVASPESKVWGYEGLWVGGNALIPTANSMNPTLTSVALAVKGAEALAASLGTHVKAEDAPVPA